MKPIRLAVAGVVAGVMALSLCPARAQQAADSDGEVLRMKQENERLRQEAATRITQLNERIKELNQRLMGNTGANPTSPTPPASGFFKR